MPLYRFEHDNRTWHWDLDRALDDQPSDLRIDVYDSQCDGCGALYEPPAPDECPLCGRSDFHPVEDLAW